jgi:hypothetical protein
MWETPLGQLSVMARTKFGLNNRVLRFETKSGEECRVFVDKVESWIEAICEEVNATGVAEMAEVEPNRWVVG